MPETDNTALTPGTPSGSESPTTPQRQADFYLLGPGYSANPLNFLCRLVEKAFLRDMQVVIQCRNDAERDQLDELLYAFKPESFLPHQIANPPVGNPAAPIVLFTCAPDAEPEKAPAASSTDGTGESAFSPARKEWLGINLGGAAILHYPRVAEVIISDAAEKQSGRLRFRQYQQLGYQIQTHPLD